MISNKNIKILSTFLYILSVTLAVIQADDSEQFTRLCSLTSNPTMCANCLNTGAIPANTKQRTFLKLLNCAYLDAQSLGVAIKIAIDDKTSDQTTTDALNKCYPLTQSIISYHDHLAHLVITEQYDAVKNDIVGYVFQKIIACSGLLGATGVKAPTNVLSSVSTVTASYGITNQVLSRVREV